MIYVFAAIMYIFTLAPINHVDFKLTSSYRIDFLNKSNSSGSTSSLLHRGIRSTIDNKQKIIVPATTACIIFFAFVFGRLALLGLTKKHNAYLSAFYIPQLNTYLSLRTLRIWSHNFMMLQ